MHVDDDEVEDETAIEAFIEVDPTIQIVDVVFGVNEDSLTIEGKACVDDEDAIEAIAG